jgi:hypothetical protein
VGNGRKPGRHETGTATAVSDRGGPERASCSEWCLGAWLGGIQLVGLVGQVGSGLGWIILAVWSCCIEPGPVQHPNNFPNIQMIQTCTI